MREYFNIFKKGIIMENPIFVLALSLCPGLAVTTSVVNALTMGLAVTFVISMNNLSVSCIRKIVNPKVRVPVYITSIATIVTVVQLVLKAFSPLLYKDLGIYLALIVVFAIILARAEVFASKNAPLPSFIDGLGMGVGFLFAMVLIGGIREFLGTGALMGIPILGEWYNAPLIVILPPGAFIIMGFLVAAFKKYSDYQEKKVKGNA